MLLKELKRFLKSWVILFSLLSFFSYLNAENIVTSVYPLKLFLKEIVPDSFKVLNVIPANVNPHLFEPTPSVLKKIEKADIFIGIQKDFDGWIEKNLKKNVSTYYLNSSKSNPHIWLSPVKMLQKSDKISQIFIERFPTYKDIIKKKLRNFHKKLIKIINRYKKEFSKFKNINIIEIHSAFDYLAKDFGLNIVDVVFISEYHEISLKHYMKLVKDAQKYHVKLLFVSSNLDSKIIYKLQKDLNVYLVKLDVIGDGENNYSKFINKILNKILISFKKCQSS